MGNVMIATPPGTEQSAGAPQDVVRLRSNIQFIVSGNSAHLMFAEEQDHRRPIELAQAAPR